MKRFSNIIPAAIFMLLAGLPAQAEKVIYHDLNVIDASSPNLRAHQSIIVQDDIILEVLPAEDVTRQQLSEARVEPGQGRYVMPGLVDTHVHLATAADFPWAEAMLQRYVYGGITTVRDMAGDTRALAELKRRLLTREIPGPALHFSALIN